MDGLSAAASGIAVVSVAFQLTEACTQLYKFWESIEDAPQEIAAIKEDLHYLSSVFEGIGCNGTPLGHCVVEGIQHCRIKVAELTSIVDKFDVGFQSSSRRRRVWAAFKAVTHRAQVQRFRESLSETKSTLTLAMIHQCIIQPPTYTISAETTVFQNLQHRSITSGLQLNTTFQPGIEKLSALEQVHMASPPFHSNLPVVPVDVAKNVLWYFDKVVPEKSMVSGKVQELMLQAIGQTATATFESTSMEILAQDGYTIDENGVVQSKTFVNSQELGYRVCHRSSSFKLAFGSVWTRTTTIQLNNDAVGSSEKSQSVTSFVFYPASWVQRLGFGNGIEAIMATGNRSWLFNCRLSVTRAVSEDSLIFELCRTGQTRAVETLLSKGIGSVVDTSPKGWKPLHFAAAGGHVDLCAMLIREGADKTALVYEGPTPSILSPISLFVACGTDLHADVKISMLRLFSECIDMADPDEDGWTVHEWLKRAYAKEKVPISRNSITWLFHFRAREEYIMFSSRNIWCALQHGVRSVLGLERNNRFLDRILGLSNDGLETSTRTHANSIGFWLALRITGRELLPMAMQAGSFLQMKGFDWTEDGLTQTQFLKALPDIYETWCSALLDCVERVEEYMRLELECCLKKLGWRHADFVRAISRANTVVEDLDQEPVANSICTRCKDDYSALGFSLVEPARIAITECIRANHTSDCACRKFHDIDVNTIATPPPVYAEQYYEEYSDSDDEFFDAKSYFSVSSSDPTQDSPPVETCHIFLDTAIMLYRAHGRTWMGEYEIGEHFCATCFLLKEQYIGEDGLGTDFPPLPESFEGLRVKR